MIDKQLAQQASLEGPAHASTQLDVGRTSLVERAGANGSDRVGSGAYSGSIFGGGASGSVVQRRAESGDAASVANPGQIAQQGTRGAGDALPFRDRIQQSFGRHDISHIRSHQGGGAIDAAHTLGARAFAVGDAVGFRGAPDLHTAAHEAAHVIQQQGGVQLAGGMDTPGDAYEQHADAVADAVVAGRSAEGLLDQFAPGGRRMARGTDAPVQRKADFALGKALVGAVWQLDADVGRVVPERDAARLAHGINQKLARNPSSGVAQTWVTETLQTYVKAVFNQSDAGLKRFNELVHALNENGWIGQDDKERLFAIVVAARKKYGLCGPDSEDENDVDLVPRSQDVFKGGRLARPTMSRNRLRMPAPNPAASKEAQEAKEKKERKEKIERAVKVAEVLSKLPLPEGAKAAIETIQTTLEIMITEKGDALAYSKHVATIGGAMFQIVASVVKSGGMNKELAEQAAEQLGSIAKFLGRLGSVFGAIDGFVKVFAGESVFGKKCTPDERMEAAIDLIKLCGGGTFGIAVILSMEEFKWIFNTIGAPILKETRELSELDLRHVLNDKTPAQAKAEIRSLSSDTAVAGSTIRRIFGATFTRSSIWTEYSIKAHWETYRESFYDKYRDVIEQVYAEDNWVKHADFAPDTKRIKIANELKALAIAFIDREAAKVQRSLR